MEDQPEHQAAPQLLGIECGATRTVALLDDGGQLIRSEAGPANVRSLNDIQLTRHFRNLRALDDGFAHPTAIGIGMAGARTESDRARIRLAASKVWPNVPCYATNDLETAMMAAEPAVPVQTTGAKKSKIQNPK